MRRRKPLQRRPSALMRNQAAGLFADPKEQQAFLDALVLGQSREQMLIVLQDKPQIRAFPRLHPEKWQPEWVVRVRDDFRPGKHSLHDKGAFYVLDGSSVFAASAMLAIPNKPRRVLDVCSSPGGKAVFAWKAFQPELLIANESLRGRTRTLIQNLHRCGVESAVVGSADSSVWARKAPASFDLVIVDAPCSGQSLMAKGTSAPGAWDPAQTDMNVNRQRRIVGNAIRCVRPGGHLLYMTCTFTRKENEKVMEWLMREHPECRAVAVPALESYRSAHSDFPSYRLFPQSGLGAGAFTCLIHLEGDAVLPDLDSYPKLWQFGMPVDPPKREEAESEEGTIIEDATDEA